MRWLRANAARYRIDATRIAMGGTSAGAVTSLLVGTRSEDPGASGNAGQSSSVGAAISISGGLPTNDTITPGDASTLFFHGTLDRTVPYAWALSNAGAMDAAGVPATFESLEGAGHVPWAYHELFVSQSAFFLYRALTLAPAAPTPPAGGQAPPATPSSPSPTVALGLSRLAKAGEKRAVLKIVCRSTSTCAGTVRLQSLRTDGGTREGTVTYAAQKYSVRAGESERVAIKLSRAGRKLMDKDDRVLVWANATLRGGAPAARKARLYR